MSSLPKTEFLIKNQFEFIDEFRRYIENNRTHFPSVLVGNNNDELEEVIDQLESANQNDSEFHGGYFGVIYDVNREAKDDTGHFYLDYLGGTEIYNDERVYDPNVKKIPAYINSQNYGTPRKPPRKRLGGGRRKKKTRKKRGGKRRKKKTRKKRGGTDEQPTPPQVPRDNDVGTKQYEPGQLGVQQPPQLPPFMLPPPANTEPVVRNRRAAIRMEGAPPHMRRSEDEREMLANRANERYRRRNRNYLRNLSGDLLERCTGNRCGLGGRRRKKKTRKKKNKKRRTKKKSRRRR